jgi:hypothetical protein
LYIQRGGAHASRVVPKCTGIVGHKVRLELQCVVQVPRGHGVHWGTGRGNDRSNPANQAALVSALCEPFVEGPKQKALRISDTQNVSVPWGGGCPEYQCPRGDSYGGVVAGPDPENQRSAVFGPRWDTNTPNLTGSRQRGRNEGPLCNKPARPAPCGEARNRWDRAARTTPTVWRVDGGTEAISAQDPIEFRCCCFFFGEGRRRVRTDTQLWRRRVIPQNHREQSSGFAHPTPDTECPGMFQSLSQLF